MNAPAPNLPPDVSATPRPLLSGVDGASRPRVEEHLRGRALWLVMPALFSAAIVVPIAIFQLGLTVRLPPEVMLPFSLVGALSTAISTAVLVVRMRVALRPLVALASGAVPPDERHLGEAAVAVYRLPDAIFALTWLLWAVGAVMLAPALALFSSDAVSWTVALRLLAMGLIFGVFAALVAQVLATRRARKVLLRLGECGLSASRLSEVLPTRKIQIRGRLLLFTAIAVFVPVAMNVDLSAVLAQQGFDRMTELRDPAEIEAAAQALRRTIYVSVGTLCALVVAVSLLAAWLVGNSLGGPLQEIAEEAVRIADGQLSTSRLVPAEDEVWAVSAAFTAMQTHMRQVVAQLKQAGQQIGDTADEIVDTSTQHEAGAAEQAAALNQTSATTEELARSARQIADNAGAVAGLAHRTLEAAEGGQLSAEAFSQSMARMQEDNRAIAEAVVKLNKRVQQIGKIVAFINGVADKSDLLALNAELEGTKAGEVGRGFSLVAGEMRRLAENVIESTKEIEGLIEEIREATSAAVNATQTGVGATTEGAQLAAELGQHLQEIVRLAGLTSDAVRAISLATQQQQSGTDQLAEAMADILRVTQESLAANRQVSAANVDLTALARELKQAVDRFEVA